MSKIHITSLLRGPRGRYKSIEAPSQPAPPTLVSATSSIDFNAKIAQCPLELQQFEIDETNEFEATAATESTAVITINNVEFIPTLNFISNLPTTTSASDPQYVAATYANDDNFEETDNDDAASSHTYVIERDSNTRTESVSLEQAEYLDDSEQSISLDLQELIYRLSAANELADRKYSSSSYFDEPTSSISIEMASLSNATTLTTTTTTTTATGATKSTTTTTITTPPTTLTSSDQSIEEEIEEAIEISEELDEGVDSAKNTKTDSDEIAVFASTSKGARGIPTSTATHADLFSIGDSDESDKMMGMSRHETPRSTDDEQFKIDDEQLSGEKITQHFVLDDEDEYNDDEDDHNSDGLQLAAVKVHSRHESLTNELEPLNGNSKRRTSLFDDSTTDDVSDFIEEEHQSNLNANDDDDDNEEETDEKESDNIDLPLPGGNDSELPAKANFRESLKSFTDIVESGSLSQASSEHSEKDHSIEELIASNHSIELESSDLVEQPEIVKISSVEETENRINSPSKEKLPLVTDLDESNENKEQSVNEPASEVDVENIEISSSFPIAHTKVTHGGNYSDDDIGDDDGDHSLELFKLRILAMKHQQQQAKEQTSPIPPETSLITICNVSSSNANDQSHVKPMERILLTEFSKDILEDITEESERNSLSNATINPEEALEIDQSSLSIEKSMTKNAGDVKDESVATPTSIISLNMIKMLEQRVSDLQELLSSKDACLASLNLQLEANNIAAGGLQQQLHQQQRRDSNGISYVSEQLGSGRDNSSLMTNSTEYRTLQEDFIGPNTDFYVELSKRDELIAKLTESLQQSLSVREQLQLESERLSNEVQSLRKQLSETNPDATQRRAPNYWLRADQESNGGQRISEISMDLISESDDDLERNFLTDNEDKMSRNSRERQLSMPRQMSEASEMDLLPIPTTDASAFSKQIEQFQKYLTPSEVRLFYMVQKKFDDFLGQELEKCRLKYESEHKIVLDRLECEKHEKDQEIKRLKQARQENDILHSKEMEDLRKYFETKCADLEKQYSDDVFSQKSQRIGADSSSESSSDSERMPEEAIITTTTAASNVSANPVNSTTSTPHLRSKENSPRKRTRAELLLSPSHRQMTPCGEAIAEELKDSNVIAEIKSFYQQKLHEIQRNHEIQTRKLNEKIKYYESRYPEDDFMQKDITKAVSVTNDALNQTADSDQLQSSANASLIIIDQDELNFNNESQVIQKIIEEYERRLQEQLILARQDIVLELERQIQNLLSETTTDDLHWPPELILLREKLTAKSQLEIAQLQMKHEEEMSRVKQDYEKHKSLQRQKNMRRSIFEMGHDTLLAQVCTERDQLRQLLKSFHHALSGLAKCVEGCENEANATLTEQVQRLLLNVTIEQQQTTTTDPMSPTELQMNLSGSINMFNLRGMLIFPDVQTLLEVVDSPTLLQFINSNDDNDLTSQFDLKECMARLNEEANYILELTEQRRRNRNETAGSVHDEKLDDGCDILASERKSLEAQSQSKRKRSDSLNDTISADGDSPFVRLAQTLNSMPADFQYMCENNEDELESATTTHGQHNAFQVLNEITKLKSRLVESETDRQKLQEELEHTISRNAELGQELQSLRNRISQLNSLNHIDYAEGYGLGAIKTPTRSSSIEGPTLQSFSQLQERARHILSSPPTKNVQSQSLQKQDHQDSQEADNNEYTILLLQMIEDFCRESDRLVDTNKRERDDLQAQIDAADKKLKATRKFVEEQAAEREQERDEFTREIDRLKCVIRDKEKDVHNILNKSRELEQFVSQIKNQKDEIIGITKQRDKMEEELKASISKIFDLREIIAELESRIEEKEFDERVMSDKIKELKSYIYSQNHSNETLQSEVISLKTEIDTSYHERIRALEKKLQNVRPTAEQFAVMEHVVEQLRDIEATLDQKTKMLESLHHSASSNSCSHSATEDVSAQGAQPASAIPVQIVDINSPLQSGSPVHPSPRQHSLTMEGVQRVIDKLAKHTRVEEAALKRIRDLEMQVSQMCAACVELQQERDTLQERMSEQSQRISALQMRLDEQRQRADDLQRIGTSDLNIRIHDLQTEVKELSEKLSVRDKQMTSLKQQLEKSKNVIHRLEAELAVKQQPDRSTIERLENELSQKQQEIQKLKTTIKNEMINKQHLPDLMETMLADKNDEIDLLREQYELKIKELSAVLEASANSSLSTPQSGNVEADQNINTVGGGDAQPKEQSGKHSARTLSDIVSIVEYDEPDVLRRATVAVNQATPLNIVHNSMEISKEAIANLTQKRTEELSGFSQLQPMNTFDDPRYFQEPHASLKTTLGSNASVTPAMQPRQINFSDLTEDSKLKTPARDAELGAHLDSLEKELESARLQLADMQQQLTASDDAIAKLDATSAMLAAEQAKCALLKSENEKLVQERDMKSEMLTKHEKELHNLRENETNLTQRINALEAELLKSTETAVSERAKLHLELKSLNETHAQYKQQQLVAEKQKIECDQLNMALKTRDERLKKQNGELKISEERMAELNSQLTKSKEQILTLQQEADRLRQQLNSDNSSKLFSVEEIAQQVEKELNYSAQLDSNILKAIESEEENNLDLVHLDKSNQTSVHAGDDVATQQGTDDENFTGERELLNQLEALRAQIAVERERNDAMRRELFAEKQHSMDIQEQDIAVLSALRKRLEKAIEQEDDLHKQLDLERERYECLNAQYTALQRAESRRNCALLLKSPTDLPRKAANNTAERTTRSLGDFESDLAERLRSEIKLLTAQNERERERSADLQRNSEREFARYKNELNERKEYCEQLNREMHKLQRERDNAQKECEHLQERLTLQSQEIESLEWRLATLQEAEAQRAARRERYQKESAELLAEMQELKTQALATEAEKEAGRKLAAQLRFDLERSTERERKLAEALAQARENFVTAASSSEENVPLKLLQNEIEVKRQMAETLQLLTEERCRLQSKCEELEKQLGNRSTVQELEERCKQLLGRYLRIESYRKALVYQKRYLKLSLLSYEAGERCLAVLRGKADIVEAEPQRDKKRLFKTVAIAVIAIHRMKYIVNVWRSGKRIVSKSTFTITQQKRSPIPSIVGPSSVAIVSSTTPAVNPCMVPSSPWFLNNNDGTINYNNNNNNNNNNNTNLYSYNNNAKKVSSNGKVK